jgi:tetratricopeptide (TPR) repeat protein
VNNPDAAEAPAGAAAPVAPGSAKPAPTKEAHSSVGTAARRARQEARRETRTPGRGDLPGPQPRPARRELDPDALAALEEERDFLLRSLRDLEREHEAGDVDDHDYEQLNDDYTARAADVLRAIEDRRALLGRPAPPDRGRRVVIGILVGLFAVVAGCTVAQAAGRRGASDQITGDIRQSSRDKTLEAQQAMGEGRYLEAINLYDEVIAAAPSEPEAHAYKGWLLRLSATGAPAGADRDLLLDRALAELDRAVALDEGYPDARVFRATTYGDVGRPADGLADLDRLRPGSVPPDLQGRVAQLRARLSEQAGGG